MPNGRFFEADLTDPALQTIRDAGGRMDTSDLIAHLEATLPLSDEDRELLKGRTDTKFSQHVRNIKCHRNIAGNLIYEGYLLDVPDGFEITPKGIAYLKKKGL